MAMTTLTPRDRVQHLVDLARKTLRYWWLVAVFAVVGGGLSFAFVILKTKRYQSWSTVFYQERIQSNVITAGREEIAQRNITEKYGEMLVARPQLAPILADPETDPFPDEPDPEVKLDKFRQAVKLEPRGFTSFRITYADENPDRAKAIVEKLTKSLQERDEQLRNDTARRTVQFITTQREAAQKELRKHELALAEFLAKHPEFAQETQPGQAEGASIRAIRDAKTKAAPTGNPRLYALERQRQRIKARLDAPEGTAIRIQQPPSAERIAAEAVVAEAQREVNTAKRELEEAQSRYTELHPTVAKAQGRLAAAMQRLAQAQAAVPPDNDTVIAPTSADDRKKLQAELQRLETQIANLQRPTTNNGSGSAAPDNSTSWIVKLETDHADLRRRVREQRERVNSLADSAFRAQIDANQKLAEAGGRLEVVDPAFKPVRPSGPGKTVFMIAGMILFLGLGFALAVGFAVIDDRLYRRADLEALDIAVLGVIPPATFPKKKKQST